MTTEQKDSSPAGSAETRCDIKVWSPECRNDLQSEKSEKYLCSSCKTIPTLEREIHHEQFPHLCGDEDNMS